MSYKKFYFITSTSRNEKNSYVKSDAQTLKIDDRLIRNRDLSHRNKSAINIRHNS